jgi:nuclear transport factor 2 (NTF2) superfamily protein
MTIEMVQEWLAAYAKAWQERDPDQVAALFAPECVYRSSPFREPHRGRDGVRSYWRRATEDQRDLDLRFGEPILQGFRVAVEWWAIIRSAGETGVWEAGTLPGCLYLIFDDEGHCIELREYWHWQDGVVSAYDGWGA